MRGEIQFHYNEISADYMGDPKFWYLETHEISQYMTPGISNFKYDLKYTIEDRRKMQCTQTNQLTVLFL